MKTLSLTVSAFASTTICLIIFLFCPHLCLLRHFEIIRCILKSVVAISTYFFVEFNWKREVEMFLWALELGQPNRYTGIPDGLNTSLKSSSRCSLLWSAWCFLPLFSRKSILSLFPEGYFKVYCFFAGLEEDLAGLVARKYLF